MKSYEHYEAGEAALVEAEGWMSNANTTEMNSKGELRALMFAETYGLVAQAHFAAIQAKPLVEPKGMFAYKKENEE
jgi:hypothetical protein